MLENFIDHIPRDPLRDDDLGPPHLPVYEATGRTVGRGAEALGKAVLTGGMGGLSMASPLVEHSAGGNVGAFIGRQLEGRLPREDHMVERIHQMSPSQGLAYIQLLEHHNDEEPHVIQAMKDAYNARRIGVTEHMKVSSLGVPTDNSFQDSLETDTAPHPGIYKLRRPGGHIGSALGTLASIGIPAAAGGLLEHSLFGTSGMVGAGLGALSGAPFAPVGREIGRSVGRGIGSLAENLQSGDRHAVQSIKDNNPQDSYAHVRALERAGQTDPETLQKMKDSYNYRRDSLALQSRAGVG